MGFDLEGLARAVARHGRVARVVVARTRGSTPRPVGADMLVWQDGQSGSIGGGALEHEAARAARAALGGGPAGLRRHALGPDLGQCCGGVVWTLCEIFDVAAVAGLRGGLSAPPWPDGQFPPESFPGKMKGAVFARPVAGADEGLSAVGPQGAGLRGGWMVEPLAAPRADVWIWGAGHVGRALVAVLAPLPDLALHWVDVAADRFPAGVPERVTVLPARAPQVLAAHVAGCAHHVIVTHSHDLDLALCDALLSRGFGSAGVIGSASKWARFRRRLRALGHETAAISRIRCPIGDPRLGKHPQAIAIGVAADIALRASVAAAAAADAVAAQ